VTRRTTALSPSAAVSNEISWAFSSLTASEKSFEMPSSARSPVSCCDSQVATSWRWATR
jgi:hypothetical protein